MPKDLINYSPFLLALFFFQSCSHEDLIAPTTETVQLSFALETNTKADVPAGSMVLLTLTNSSGAAVLTDQALRIEAVDDHLISEAVELPADEYIVTEFLVVHDDAALYVTPKVSSEFAKEVTIPLSYAFHLMDDRIVTLQVVETRNQKAEKFGYGTFARKKAPQWKIMVFTRENGSVTPSDAWSFLIAPGISYGAQLRPGMNTLPFDGDPQQVYKLTVEKPGYVTYSTDFVYDDIRGKGNKPFKIILDRVANENTFTITPPKAEGEFTFRLGLRGTGSLNIDWGDGTVETIHFAPDPSSPIPDASYVEPAHQYGLPTSDEGYQVSVNGDLDQVFHLETISVYASEIDTRNLTGLQNLTLFGMPINGLLDLSANSQLKSLRLEATYAWEIRLPQSHGISQVYLSDLDGTLSESVVDTFIADIHRNAVANDLRDGMFTILRPVSLSDESTQRLDELAQEYAWSIDTGE